MRHYVEVVNHVVSDEVDVFEAADGTKFYSSEECAAYEKKLDTEKLLNTLADREEALRVGSVDVDNFYSDEYLIIYLCKTEKDYDDLVQYYRMTGCDVSYMDDCKKDGIPYPKAYAFNLTDDTDRLYAYTFDQVLIHAKKVLAIDDTIKELLKH